MHNNHEQHVAGMQTQSMQQAVQHASANHACAGHATQCCCFELSRFVNKCSCACACKQHGCTFCKLILCHSLCTLPASEMLVLLCAASFFLCSLCAAFVFLLCSQAGGQSESKRNWGFGGLGRTVLGTYAARKYGSRGGRRGTPLLQT